MKKDKRKYRLHPHGTLVLLLATSIALGASLLFRVGSSHSARRPTALTPNQAQETSTVNFNFSNVNPFIDIAQSFQTSENNDLNRISVFIGRVGNPQTAVVRIVDDNNGMPGTVILADGVIDTSTVSTTPGWVDVNIGTPPALLANQTYWFIVDTRYPDESNYYIIGSLPTNDYAKGIGMYSKSWKTSTWGDAVRDFTFRIWLAVGINQSSNGDPNSPPIEDKYYSYVFEFSSGETVSGVQPYPPANTDMTAGGYTMSVHVSCSDMFANGYGSVADPTQSAGHPSVSGFRIWKYVNGDFKSDCAGGADVLGDLDTDGDKKHDDECKKPKKKDKDDNDCNDENGGGDDGGGGSAGSFE